MGTFTNRADITVLLMLLVAFITKRKHIIIRPFLTGRTHHRNEVHFVKEMLKKERRGFEQKRNKKDKQKKRKKPEGVLKIEAGKEVLK